jgi:hypothetical protein
MRLTSPLMLGEAIACRLVQLALAAQTVGFRTMAVFDLSQAWVSRFAMSAAGKRHRIVFPASSLDALDPKPTSSCARPFAET